MTAPTIEQRVTRLEAKDAEQDTAIETLTGKVNQLIIGQAVTHKTLALILDALGKGPALPTLTEDEEDALFD